MAEQAAEQTRKNRDKSRQENFKSFTKIQATNEPPKLNTTSTQQPESKNIANLVKLKQLYEKYDTLVDKKMIEHILKDKK